MTNISSYSGSGVYGKDFENLTMSLIDAAYMIGIMLGPSFGGFFFDFGGFFLPFLIFGCCSILLTVSSCVFCLKSRRDSDDNGDGQDSEPMSLRMMVRVPGMLVSMVSLMVTSSAWDWYQSSIAQHLQRKYSLTASQVSLYLARQRKL